MTAAPLSAQDAATSARPAWEFSAQLYWYALPDEPDFLLLLGHTDLGAWHFEARYNYEEMHTAPFFAGRTFSFGDKLTAEVTPMLGAFVGQIDGLAPGLELDFTLGRFEWYVESEYVWDLRDFENNYFYAWSELSLHVTSSLRTGLVGQRTRAYQTPLDIQRGLLVETTLGRFRLGTWWFNPGTSSDFISIGFGVDF